MDNNGFFSLSAPARVAVGPLVISCDSFKAVGGRNFSEKSTVSGDTSAVNTNLKGLKITVSGRVIDEFEPIRPLRYLYGVMKADSILPITYRDVIFSGCHIQNIIVTDSGEGYIGVSVTLVTYKAPSEREM